MIEGLDRVLEGSGQRGVTELRGLLQELLGGPDITGRLLEEQLLQPRAMRVFRLRFAVNGRTRSLVIKRLKPEIAQRNELVAKRWLPAIGLNDGGPPLLGSVAESNVRDAIYALEAWQPAAQQDGLRDRLLDRLYKLRDELPERAQALAEGGGPETLLHGDLWAINVFVIPDANGRRARLIDWDHAAVGPASYDLSTFLLRFPSEHRLWVFELYRQAVSDIGWRLPGESELNLLFETHEYARFANRIIWPAIALVMDGAAWGAEALAEIDGWFEQFESVLRPPCRAEVTA